jgi:hypothetical protein
MAYKTKKIYERIAKETGFPVKTVMEIDDATIGGVYTLGSLARRYLAKPTDVGRVIDMLTDADKNH